MTLTRIPGLPTVSVARLAGAVTVWGGASLVTPDAPDSTVAWPSASALDGNVKSIDRPGAMSAVTGLGSTATWATVARSTEAVAWTPRMVSKPSFTTVTIVLNGALAPTGVGLNLACVIRSDGVNVTLELAIWPSESVTVSVTIRDADSAAKAWVTTGPPSGAVSPSPKSQSKRVSVAPPLPTDVEVNRKRWCPRPTEVDSDGGRVGGSAEWRPLKRGGARQAVRRPWSAEVA